jgi:hypothetical protein
MGVALLLTVVFLWIILAVVPTFLRERREDQERRSEMLKWAQERAARRLTKEQWMTVGHGHYTLWARTDDGRSAGFITDELHAMLVKRADDLEGCAAGSICCCLQQ